MTGSDFDEKIPTTLPTEIGQLSNLERFRFEYLQGPLPTELYKLTNLNNLNLLFTGAVGIGLDSLIGELYKLEYLSFQVGHSDSYFNSTIPTEIGQLTDLSKFV